MVRLLVIYLCLLEQLHSLLLLLQRLLARRYDLVHLGHLRAQLGALAPLRGQLRLYGTQLLQKSGLL